jgi:hypothetical protein
MILEGKSVEEVLQYIEEKQSRQDEIAREKARRHGRALRNSRRFHCAEARTRKPSHCPAGTLPPTENPEKRTKKKNKNRGCLKRQPLLHRRKILLFFERTDFDQIAFGIGDKTCPLSPSIVSGGITG